ncbi:MULTISPECIES: S-layer homology domain-containing protein [unclassified Paenibacillus]|nr:MULTISPECIES: S-layer homology domain-containing protein [unclassified Paenibacillus]
MDALASNNIITGYADNTFKPEKDITRAEFATIVSRLLETAN